MHDLVLPDAAPSGVMHPLVARLIAELGWPLLGNRSDKVRGRSLTPLTRLRIARTHQEAQGKLDWERLRAIRASDESEAVLAQRYGVSKPTIGHIRRNESWREEGGMFTALIPGRARA